MNFKKIFCLMITLSLIFLNYDDIYAITKSELENLNKVPFSVYRKYQKDYLNNKDIPKWALNYEVPNNLFENGLRTNSYEEVVISAVGDCTLGSYYGQSSYGRFDSIANANGLEYFFSGANQIFNNDTLTIANLEGPLTNHTEKKDKEFAMKGSPNYSEILKLGGVDAVNLSNNHIYDYGETGYKDTIGALKNVKINYFDENNLFYKKHNDITIGIAGFTIWNDSSYNRNKVITKIKELKEKSNLSIIMFHWGEESSYEVQQYQKNIARLAIDNGVDLVLGSHSHTIQGIETYKGKNIVYSLGNFCFGANRNPKDKDTFIYQQKFSVDKNKVESKEVKIIPFRVSRTNKLNDFRPTQLVYKDKERVLKKINRYSINFKY